MLWNYIVQSLISWAAKSCFQERFSSTGISNHLQFAICFLFTFKGFGHYKWTHIAQGFSDSSLLEKAIGLYNTRNEKISFRATLPGYDQSPAGAWPASAGQVARPPLGLLTGPKLLQRTQGTCPGPRVPHCFIPTGSRTPHTHLFLAPTRVRTSSISLA